MMGEPDNGGSDQQPETAPRLTWPAEGNLNISDKVVSRLKAVCVTPQATVKFDDITHG